MTSKTEKEAWEYVHMVMPGLEKDEKLSERAGYPIYSSYRGTLSDLNTRLEMNFNNGKTLTIWIDREVKNNISSENSL